MTRARRLGAGLAAVVVLACAVVGLPVVLYRFGGSPLPHHLAGWHQAEVALGRPDDGSLLLAITRDCSWLAWLLFTGCVLAEAQAAILGRTPPQLRAGGVQAAAAHLVALVALAFAAPPATTLSASVTAIGNHHGPSATATRLITVRGGDCLWSIAQRYLGAGDRYPAIARLNYGRDMGNGQVFANPALIEPGWQLFLPGDGSGSHAAIGHPAAARAPGDQHPGHATKDPHYRRRHSAARLNVAGHDSDRPAEGSSGGNGLVTARRSSSRPAIASQAPGSRGPLSAAEAGYQTSASADLAAGQLPQAAVFVTGTLAGAVLTGLTRLRRRQWQQRRRGRRIALPADPGVLAAEQRLRAAAAAQVVPLETLQDALASLEAGILGAGQLLPEIVGLHVTPDMLEVLLAGPAPEAPPAPYSISPGRQGMCWALGLPAVGPGDPAGRPAGRSTARPACHLLPGLVTVGATAAGYLLLDLESLQVTGCDGPPELIDRVVSTAATELATGQWSAWYDLILVGCDELEVLGRAEHCRTLDEALAILDARSAAAWPRIAARAPADVRELRLAEPDNEDWGLTILISRVEPAPDQLQRLLELAEDGPGGIAAFVAGDQEAASGRMAPTVLQLAPDPQEPDGIIANVVPLQITVRPRALSAADYDAITALFAVAAKLDDAGPADEPYRAYDAPPWLRQAADPAPSPMADAPGADAPWLIADALSPGADAPWLIAEAPSPAADAFSPAAADVAEAAGKETAHAPRWPGVPEPLRVKVLGPFTITGMAEQLQPKQAELVLALALAAPAGLANSALCAILGTDPDHPKPRDSVRQIITRTRRRLGPARDGREYIIHTGNGHYLLHPDASLDWAEFRELTASGQPADLRAAVALIGGQPFTGSYFWWIDIPLIETVRAELADAAEALAEAELAGGSPRAAARAARAGLLAEPSAEQLWRVLMRAEHAAGNLAGVAEAWRRCLDAIEDIAPDGEPHPDTAALHWQLTARTRQREPAR